MTHLGSYGEWLARSRADPFLCACEAGCWAGLARAILQKSFVGHFKLSDIFLHFFTSLGKLFHFSHTRTEKKFFHNSSRAGGVLTFSGSAASLVMRPPSAVVFIVNSADGSTSLMPLRILKTSTIWSLHAWLVGWSFPTRQR